jgi:hypothetical protein
MPKLVNPGVNPGVNPDVNPGVNPAKDYNQSQRGFEPYLLSPLPSFALY